MQKLVLLRADCVAQRIAQDWVDGLLLPVLGLTRRCWLRCACRRHFGRLVLYAMQLSRPYFEGLMLLLSLKAGEASIGHDPWKGKVPDVPRLRVLDYMSFTCRPTRV